MIWAATVVVALASCSEQPANKCVGPLPASVDVAAIKNAPSDTISSDQKLYLDNLQDHRSHFTNIDTKMRQRDG